MKFFVLIRQKLLRNYHLRTEVEESVIIDRRQITLKWEV